MAWISSGLGWSWEDGLNLAAMMTRRSLAVMSAVDGSVFVVYQGASRRRASVSAGWWPTVAYQQMAIAWQASMNGIVRSTAAAVRLRAWPMPKSCFASSIATSIAHLAAYLSITCAVYGFCSVVTRARSHPVFDLSRMRMTVTGLAPVTEYHRQVSAAAAMVSVLPYRVTMACENAAAAAILARDGSRSPFTRGRPFFPVRSGGRPQSAALLRSLVVQVTPSGSSFSSSPA